MNIFSNCFEWLSFAWQFAPFSFGAWPLLSTNISQGSVAMHWRGGKIFYYHFSTNLLLNLPVKEFWKLVSICQNYSKKSTGLFFRGHSVDGKSTRSEWSQKLSLMHLNSKWLAVKSPYQRIDDLIDTRDDTRTDLESLPISVLTGLDVK